ncbi:MAG: tryptophan 7-halogenase [Fuerstiella sp.]|nr:tryptophan 7-halogenase [Fuerstiella sp.]
MSVRNVDILILGSGFGGSLLSMILARAGRSVAVVDRARHPRFAIGESSTPLADTTLATLAEQYDLPELLPLTQYGTWKQCCPDITCGLKRGFSYFGHSTERDFDEAAQMLVTASSSNESSDTHWLRSDVDAYMFEQAGRSGVIQFEGAGYSLARDDGHWRVTGVANESSFQISAPFIVDATGSTSALLDHLNIASQTATLKTNSRAIFGHFTNVPTVESMFREGGVDCSRHPFPCDAAAVHHVLKNGWMWQLRFDDDSVSAGFVFDDRIPDTQRSPELNTTEEWDRQIQSFAFLQRQFSSAAVVRPDTGIQRTQRLQRLTTEAAGKSWAALPNTAGFIDPLHSTGIAHTLFGIRRLAAILLSSSDRQKEENHRHYSDQLINELRNVDELVEGCYAALPSFRLWCDWCMLYFAAVTSMEQTAADNDVSFLRANDHEFRNTVRTARSHLQKVVDAGSTSEACNEFEGKLRKLLQPWNHAGLLDDDCGGMYSRTAAPV